MRVYYFMYCVRCVSQKGLSKYDKRKDENLDISKYLMVLVSSHKIILFSLPSLIEFCGLE